MAFPSRPHERLSAEAGSVSRLNGATPSPAVQRSATPSPRCHLQVGPQIEGEHQLEKLEFALAVALTRGDQGRSRILRDQIEALGGNREEPGT